jgi:ABC-type nickel/cobalt efflux system permease component RcnA
MFGMLFVVGGLVLAALKYINPIVAAIFHVSGGLVVVFNSFRLVRVGEELEPYAPVPTAPPGGDQGHDDAAGHPHDHAHDHAHGPAHPEPKLA